MLFKIKDIEIVNLETQFPTHATILPIHKFEEVGTVCIMCITKDPRDFVEQQVLLRRLWFLQELSGKFSSQTMKLRKTVRIEESSFVSGFNRW